MSLVVFADDEQVDDPDQPLPLQAVELRKDLALETIAVEGQTQHLDRSDAFHGQTAVIWSMQTVTANILLAHPVVGPAAVAPAAAQQSWHLDPLPSSAQRCYPCRAPRKSPFRGGQSGELWFKVGRKW